MKRRLVAALLVLGACGGPVGWIPDGKLDGTLVETPVDDWSFARTVQKLQLETDPADPYSVNVYFVSEGAALWVTAGYGRMSTWASHLAEDPRAIVRIGDALYPRTAVRVTDAAEIAHVQELYRAKYDYSRDPSGAFGPVFFRLDAR